MLDFTLTKEQIAFQQKVRDFAVKELAPGAIERDAQADFTDLCEITLSKMGPMGLLGVNISKEYGGMGLGNIEVALMVFELCRVDGSAAVAPCVNVSLGGMPIYLFGTEEQKQKYLKPMASGQKLGAFGLTEENAGSDAAMQETVAVLDGDSYVLNGRKKFISNGGFAETYIIMAMTDKAQGANGISAFIVEKGTPGFTFGKEYLTMGIRASAQKELIFENCRIPKENIIGAEGEGFKIAMTALDVGRICVGAQGVGTAYGAYELAMKHARSREQFGKKISKFQGVSFMLADMKMKIETAKLMCLKAAWLADNNMPFGLEASMAKAYCTDISMQVTTDAVQIMAGEGYLTENEAERMMRDAKIQQIYEGTNQVQRVVISNNIIRNDNVEGLV